MTPEYHNEVQYTTKTSQDYSQDLFQLWTEPRTVYICDDCGKERHPGDWPQCPHISGNFGEEPLEPYFDENISESGEYITTRAQRRAIMARNHMDYRPKRFDLLTGRVTYFDVGKR